MVTKESLLSAWASFNWPKMLKYYLIVVAVLVGGSWLYANSPYTLNYNASYSLPYTFVAVRKWHPEMQWNYGDLMAFQWKEYANNPLYDGDWTALKVVTAKGGDRILVHSDHLLEVVTKAGRQSFEVLPHNRFGRVLHIFAKLGKDGVIPEGYFFLTTPHTRSYDSRYAEVGLIPASRIVGKGVWVW